MAEDAACELGVRAARIGRAAHGKIRTSAMPVSEKVAFAAWSPSAAAISSRGLSVAAWHAARYASMSGIPVDCVTERERTQRG